MPPRIHLPVVDRRALLRGAGCAILAALVGCRLSLEDDSATESAIGPDGGLTTVVPLSPGFERCGDDLCLDLAHPTNENLRTVDGARTLTFEGKKLIIVRVSLTAVVVLSALCTHTGCTVTYAPARSDIECPCHGSLFALDGTVTRGPAAKPLAPFAATLDPATGIVTIGL